jgi:hypothetical protein
MAAIPNTNGTVKGSHGLSRGVRLAMMRFLLLGERPIEPISQPTFDREYEDH